MQSLYAPFHYVLHLEAITLNHKQSYHFLVLLERYNLAERIALGVQAIDTFVETLNSRTLRLLANSRHAIIEWNSDYIKIQTYDIWFKFCR